MTSWAIVAIPEDGETVWKVSSEKVPHMTLLFLGEQSDPAKAEHIATYLQHTINTSLNKFGANVRNRGILGDDMADVLFFEGNDRLKPVMDFRSFLLSDDVISEAYHSAQQFDGWTPHLTLGYPKRPAKKPPEGVHSLPFYSVYFDKIALWVDDFDGPTFNLDYANEHDMAMDSLSHRNAERAQAHQVPLTARDVVMKNVLSRKALREPSNLKHHGIGARKVVYKNPIEDAVIRVIDVAAKTSQELSAEGRFLKHALSGELQTGSTKDAKKQYVRENQLAFLRHLEHFVGGRPSERANRRFDIATRPDEDWVVSSADMVAHTGTVETRIHPHTDDYGMITGYSLVHDELTQDDMRYALQHFGVKGMKWGVRRKTPDSGGGDGGGGGLKKRRQARAEFKAEAKRQASSDDANNVRDVQAKLKKGKTQSLSNAEMQQVITRMQLEAQLSAAMVKSPKAKGEGRKFVESLVVDTAKTAMKQAVQEVATKEAKSFLNARMEEMKNRQTT